MRRVRMRARNKVWTVNRPFGSVQMGFLASFAQGISYWSLPARLDGAGPRVI
jgi:hypothetical protein